MASNAKDLIAFCEAKRAEAERSQRARFQMANAFEHATDDECRAGAAMSGVPFIPKARRRQLVARDLKIAAKLGEEVAAYGTIIQILSERKEPRGGE